MDYQKYAQKLTNSYPAIEDLARKAKQRLPLVAWEYLDSGTGNDQAAQRNLDQIKEVTIAPQFMRGNLTLDLKTELFGRTYHAPFGVAPVGLTGLMWPKAELMLGRMAKAYNIPYSLSTVATQTPETVGPLLGDMGWFQLYPPQDKKIRADLLKRAKDSGFHTLLITADVPAPSRRERTKRAGMQMPPKITPRFVWQGITHPSWTIATLQAGIPKLRTVASYIELTDMASVGEFVRFDFRGDLSWDYVKEVRDIWDGPVVLKGLLHPEDARKAVEIGLDGIGVSNHGGRQFDGAPAAIDVLPEMVKAVDGRAKIIFDSGIRTGLDVIRALALGADFVLCGRAFMYGVSALGELGAYHAAQILIDDMKVNMYQLGTETVDQIKQLEAKIVTQKM